MDLEYIYSNYNKVVMYQLGCVCITNGFILAPTNVAGAALISAADVSATTGRCGCYDWLF